MRARADVRQRADRQGCLRSTRSAQRSRRRSSMRSAQTGNVPLVSVVMSAHNKSPYITAAVQSVLAQLFTDFELLIRDDGSNDGTGKLLERLAMRDARSAYPASSGQRYAGPSRRRQCGCRGRPSADRRANGCRQHRAPRLARATVRDDHRQAPRSYWSDAFGRGSTRRAGIPGSPTAGEQPSHRCFHRSVTDRRSSVKRHLKAAAGTGRRAFIGRT